MRCPFIMAIQSKSFYANATDAIDTKFNEWSKDKNITIVSSSHTMVVAAMANALHFYYSLNVIYTETKAVYPTPPEPESRDFHNRKINKQPERDDFKDMNLY